MDLALANTAARLDRRRALALALAAASTRAWAEPGSVWRDWPADKAVPPLALSTLDGTRWQLADQLGKVVLLNFWATWCEPCRDEMPALAALAARHANDGLVVATVNYREGTGNIRRFVEAQSLTLPVLLDVDGEAARVWTPRVFPSTALIDRRGRPQGVMIGEFDWTSPAARARLAPLLDKA